MKLGLTLQGYNDFSRKNTITTQQTLPQTQPSSDMIKYSELTSLAFSGQIAQIKQTSNQQNELEATKAYPLKGVEYAKVWPLDLNSIKAMHKRFKNSQAFNNIPEDKAPTMAIYALDGLSGVYTTLIHRLIIDEGAVLFDANKTGTKADESLAHESYHSQRALYFSQLSDKAIEKAIDKRFETLLLNRNIPMIELMSGEKIPQFSPETIQLIIQEAKKPLESDVGKEVIEKIHAKMSDYSLNSVNIFVKTLRRQMQIYQNNLVIAYEPVLENDVFSIEKLKQQIPESLYKRMERIKGMSKDSVIKYFLEEKPGKLIQMGYTTPKEIEKARAIRAEILNTTPIKEGSQEEAKLIAELDTMFEGIEANYISKAGRNDKAEGLNKYKIFEEYVYATEEINARQHGLKHRMDNINAEIETSSEYKGRQLKQELNKLQIDYDLNETMLQLKEIRKQAANGTTGLDQQIKELTEKATELTKHAEYTVPKMLGKKNNEYVPFSYGDNYRTA